MVDVEISENSHRKEKSTIKLPPDMQIENDIINSALKSAREKKKDSKRLQTHPYKTD